MAEIHDVEAGKATASKDNETVLNSTVVLDRTAVETAVNLDATIVASVVIIRTSADNLGGILASLARDLLAPGNLQHMLLNCYWRILKIPTPGKINSSWIAAPPTT